MTAKKVYVVGVSLRFDMFVVAENEAAAMRVAEDHADDERENHSLSVRSAHEADPARHALEDSIPWGDNGDEANPDKTVAELIAEQVEREREAEEAVRIEANQLKLPLGGGAP